MNSINSNKKERNNPLTILVYYCSLPIIYLLSSLPLKVLYWLSDFLYFILFYVTGYRKKVVLENLRNSFPEKTEEQISIICRKFYKNLCDVLVEIIKMITISKKSLAARCKLSPEASALFSRLAAQHKSVIMAMGHVGNWEWSCVSFNMQATHQLFVIYHPISNKYFNELMQRVRSRTGTRLIAMENTFREMIQNKNTLNATAFVADQTPKPDNAYWTTFLNQDTPVFKGIELIAKKMNLPVVYTSVKRIKRGQYEMRAEELVKYPKETTEGQIAELYTKRLEQDIIDQPEAWLWSHRRWKHKRAISTSAIT